MKANNVFFIGDYAIEMPENISKILGKSHKTSNENICCLFYTLIEYLHNIKDKNKNYEGTKQYKHFDKYWNRIKEIFNDNSIDKNKLFVKVQNLSLGSFFYYFILHGELLNFELKKSFAVIFRKAVEFYDDNGDSYVINNQIYLSCIKNIIDVCIKNLKDLSNIHFFSKILRILLKERLIYENYVDLILIQDVLDMAEDRHCDLSSEAQIMLEKIFIPKNISFYKILDRKLSENTKLVDEEFLLKKINSQNYLFRRELVGLWIKIFQEYGFNSNFVSDFCNNLEIIKSLFVHLGSENTNIRYKILELLTLILKNISHIKNLSVHKQFYNNKSKLENIVGQVHNNFECYIEENNSLDLESFRKQIDETQFSFIILQKSIKLCAL